MTDKLVASVTEVTEEFDIQALKPVWQDLEKRSQHRFFLSWYWIQAWLITFKPKAKLISVSQNDKVVALGFICSRKILRHKIMPVTQCKLNETGMPNHDQQWIEYNSFLVDDSVREVAMTKAINTLWSEFEWDEFLVGASTSKQVHELQKLLDLSKHITWETRVHGVDLNGSENLT